MHHPSVKFSLLAMLVCATGREFFVEAALHRPRPWRYFGDGEADVLVMDKRGRYDVLDPMSDDIHAINRRRSLWAGEDGEGAWSRGRILDVHDMSKRGRYDVLDPMSDDIHAISKRLSISNDYEGSAVHLGAKRGRYDVLDPMSDDIHAISKRQLFMGDEHSGLDREVKRGRYDVLDPMSDDIHAISKRQSLSDADKEQTLRLAVHLAQLLEATHQVSAEEH